MTFLMRPYIQKRSRYFYVLFILFTVTGLFSMYFHMTLSFLGQMLDEIAILWLLASGYSIWLPRCYFPTFLGQNRSWYISLIVTITLLSTFLSFLKPTINAYALNAIGLHIVYIVVQEYKKHVLISFTFPYGMVILAMVDSTYEMPNQTIKVRYWPRDTWPVGLPYVEIGDDHKSC
ncbi:ACER1 [Cervus elaphus hippelaphus]|uniref:Alkaline ceramidase n=1 Tax=Cervus elaphus hippelaphus TaxID=46360 RepID=A0A212D2E6_CEREH|nr:ACER1 [Cervus elaphus hippelaphus]